jgi:hypothetical protein
MLGLSARFDALGEAARSPRMRELLYQAQANDAYWHGLFGGLYLPHLRRAVFNSMIGLEALLDREAPRAPLERRDIDLDGTDELALHNGIVQAIVRCDHEAAVVEFDSYSLSHNFADSLMRREEHYYAKMNLGHHAQAQDGGIASAHDRVSFKHAIAQADIEPDARPRALFLDHWLSLDGEAALAPHYAPSADAPGDRPAARFQARLPGGTVSKQISIADNRLTVRYRLDLTSDGRFDTQLNLAMPACDGFLGRYLYEGSIPGGFGQPLRLESASTLSLEDGVLGGVLELLTSAPATLVAQPHFSVSQSEDGFEKIMQAVTITLGWAVSAGVTEFAVALEVRRA